jgi:hypothetical protein
VEGKRAEGWQFDRYGRPIGGLRPPLSAGHLQRLYPLQHRAHACAKLIFGGH